MSDEWTEVNLIIASQSDELPVLSNVVDPLIHSALSQYIASWFYNSYADPGSLSIRVRIFWLSTTQVATAKKVLSGALDAEKRNGVIVDWYEGSHGVRNQTYPGETEEYGAEMWESTYKLWESQSEFALNLLKYESSSSLSKKSFVEHWERSVHLLTNRLLLSLLDEVYLSLRQAGGYLAAIGNNNPNAQIQIWSLTLAQVVEHIRQQVATTGRPMLTEIIAKD